MAEKGNSAAVGGGPSAFSRYLGLVASCFFLGLGLLYLAFPNIHAALLKMIAILASGDVRTLKAFILSFGWWAPAVSFFLMILQTLIAPLPAFVLAIVNAMVFGLFYGCLLTCVSALLAALVAFWLSRWAGRPFVERWLVGHALDVLSERYGAWGVLVLRLFPIISFDFVSFAAGLTAMRARHFALATFVGMFPAAVAYSLLGDSIESANRWSLIGGGILLTVLVMGMFLFRKSRAWANLGLAPGALPEGGKRHEG